MRAERQERHFREIALVKYSASKAKTRLRRKGGVKLESPYSSRQRSEQTLSGGFWERSRGWGRDVYLGHRWTKKWALSNYLWSNECIMYFLTFQ